MEGNENVWTLVFIRNDGSVHKLVVEKPDSFYYYANQVKFGHGLKVALLLNGEIAKVYSNDEGFKSLIDVSGIMDDSENETL